MTQEDDIHQIMLQNAQIMQKGSKEGILSVSGAIKLTSTNLSQSFSTAGKYWYSGGVYIVGGASTDTNVNLVCAQDQISSPIRLLLNTTVLKVNFKGLKLNSVYTDSTSLGSASIYLMYVGYSHPKTPELLY